MSIKKQGLIIDAKARHDYQIVVDLPENNGTIKTWHVAYFLTKKEAETCVDALNKSRGFRTNSYYGYRLIKTNG